MAPINGNFYLALVISMAQVSFGSIQMKDQTESSGVAFRHHNGALGNLWLPEIMGSGVAVLDINGDEKLDLWFVQSGPLHGDQQICDAIYKNTTTETSGLQFVDVSQELGICASGYGMGIATGDIDNDGDTDVFLANFGTNQLWINTGDGYFVERSTQSGITNDHWSVSATFTDINNDNLLDLYIANYVDFSISAHKNCKDDFGSPSYCSPVVYNATKDTLYINQGNNKFLDATEHYDISSTKAPGLGVIARDFDHDGDQDVLVANDMADNLLWINDGNGKFSNEALFAGIAVNADANVEAGMGLIAEDVDFDCDVDVFMTHLDAQTNTLYINDGLAYFSDRTNHWGLGPSSLSYTGFGTGWIDLDNDTDLDLITVNGAVTTIIGKSRQNDNQPYNQRNQIWVNQGRRFQEFQPEYFSIEEVSRGAAFGDLDNDGDIDLVITNNNGKARVYENISQPMEWIGIIPSRSKGPVDSTQVRLVDSSPNCRKKTFHSDGSYASSSDPRIVFGLGKDNQKQTIEIHWPDGSISEHPGLPTNQYHYIRQPMTKQSQKLESE